ncbi:hypothetical protein E2C01_015580 [Portunus trituberculatus]|uniref:Uncharacterized protein n=1 Tax=Portunus trituberculatus TaxID=210409 RepID=A0A5B7DNE8_PORTR|nr:hypothetical protein [Portunus trituberculatus]
MSPAVKYGISGREIKKKTLLESSRRGKTRTRKDEKYNSKAATASADATTTAATLQDQGKIKKDPHEYEMSRAGRRGTFWTKKEIATEGRDQEANLTLPSTSQRAGAAHEVQLEGEDLWGEQNLLQGRPFFINTSSLSPSSP